MKMISPENRRQLKASAHHLKALAQVGKKGITETFVKEITQLLNDHELIKVKFNEFKEEKKDLSTDLAKKTKSEVVAVTGNVAILFKQQAAEDKRKYLLK